MVNNFFSQIFIHLPIRLGTLEEERGLEFQFSWTAGPRRKLGGSEPGASFGRFFLTRFGLKSFFRYKGGCLLGAEKNQLVSLERPAKKHPSN